MRVKMPPAMRIVQDNQADQDAEPTGDAAMTCRICQRNFDLADVIRFIHQRVLQCTPPSSTSEPAGRVTPPTDDPTAGLNGRRRPSGTATRRRATSISDRDKLQLNGLSPTPSMSSMSSEGRRDEDARQRRAEEEEEKVKSRLVDACANTTESEPGNVVCFTCKNSFDSAWALVKHVQEDHGVNIYMHAPAAARAVTARSPPPAAHASPPRPPSPPPRPAASTAGPTRRPAAVVSPPPVSRSSLPVLPPMPAASAHLAPTSCHSGPFDLPFLRMPLTGEKSSPFPSMLSSPFGRPPSHAFRMENIISEQFRLQPQLPMSFELGARPRPPLGIPLEPMDFYSQRLRQLAGATLPPQELLSPPAKRPRVSGVSPPAGFGSPAGPSTSSPGPVRNTPPTGTPRTGATGKPTRKEKPRACEHCHKVFRFQSNLIVHRRIHTGEKPYKCKICSHACTQSSKLKRHMKTHMKELDQISVEKNLQASDDVKEEDEDGSVQEEDEEEEEEEEELLDEDEEGSSEELADMDGPEDLSTKSAASTPVPTSLAAAQNVLPPTPSSEKSSLVGELMDKFGLSNINTYRDAYKQALRESGKEEERTSESDHSDGEARDSEAARESEARESDRNEESEERDSETHDSEFQQNKTFDNGVSEREAPGKDAEKSETKSDSRENELVERRSTIKVREEFGGGLLTQQQPPALDLSRASVLGSFEAAFDPARRLKLGREPDPSMFPNLWLPPMSLPHEFPFPPRGPLPPEFLNHTKASEALKSPQRGLHQAFPLKPGGGDSRVSLDSCSPSPKRSSDRSRRDTCEYCGKVFKNCSNLTVHRRSHTGEKPYHCSMCNYACAQSSKLTRHMKTHGRMGKDVYQCRFCNMPFSVASTLEKHMRKCVVSQNNKTGLLPPVLPGH